MPRAVGGEATQKAPMVRPGRGHPAKASPSRQRGIGPQTPVFQGISSRREPSYASSFPQFLELPMECLPQLIPMETPVPDAHVLTETLNRIDGRGYKSYSEIRGRFDFDRFTLFVDHIQGDPFAAPSKLRIRVPAREAGLPDDLTAPGIRRLASADFLARSVRTAIAELTGTRRARGNPDPAEQGRAGGRTGGRGSDHRGGRGSGRGSGKSGQIFIDAGGQEVLERTAVLIDPDWIEARIELGLPAAGRRILGREAIFLLVEQLPRLVEAGLLGENLSLDAMRAFVECVENQESIRRHLDEIGCVAFVADGSLLPRASGASELPMTDAQAIRFRSPESQAVEIEIPNPIGEARTRTLRGMGIRRGITLIVGGGYHGKSTLLRALETCIYPHVPGDGREYVVAAPDLVKIRAEDGRSVSGVDIHGFIDGLPGNAHDGRHRTRAFSSPDASGSTSQAANIAEALELGARGLLLDEDTSATNFMVRDARMQRLVHRDHEPITPFVDRIRELHERLGVSTVLVMGGCGDYFGVADTVIMMRDYQAQDVTQEAHRIANENESGRLPETTGALEPVAPRRPLASSFVASRGRRQESISARGRELILYGEESLDLRHLAQLVDPSQTRAIAQAIRLASQDLMGEAPVEEPSQDPETSVPTLAAVLEALDALFDDEGLDVLDRHGTERGTERHPGNFARPRRYEVGGAINRMRSLKVQPTE
jgi:predicted ABC-class ATPase